MEGFRDYDTLDEEGAPPGTDELPKDSKSDMVEKQPHVPPGAPPPRPPPPNGILRKERTHQATSEDDAIFSNQTPNSSSCEKRRILPLGTIPMQDISEQYGSTRNEHLYDSGVK